MCVCVVLCGDAVQTVVFASPFGLCACVSGAVRTATVKRREHYKLQHLHDRWCVPSTLTHADTATTRQRQRQTTSVHAHFSLAHTVCVCACLSVCLSSHLTPRVSARRAAVFVMQRRAVCTAQSVSRRGRVLQRPVCELWTLMRWSNQPSDVTCLACVHVVCVVISTSPLQLLRCLLCCAVLICCAMTVLLNCI